MKATIRAKAVFDVPMTDEELRVLAALSAAHYDGTCRAASQDGGFLRGWRNRCDWLLEDKQPLGDFQVNASWRELDLLLKCLEGARYLRKPADVMIAAQLTVRFCTLLDSARLLLAEWKHEVVL